MSQQNVNYSGQGQTNLRPSQNSGYVRVSQNANYSGNNQTTTYVRSSQNANYQGTTVVRSSQNANYGGNNQGITYVRSSQNANYNQKYQNAIEVSRADGQSRIISENRLPERLIDTKRGEQKVQVVGEGEAREVSRNVTVRENIRTNRLEPVEQRPSIQKRKTNRDVTVTQEQPIMNEKIVEKIIEVIIEKPVPVYKEVEVPYDVIVETPVEKIIEV